MNSTLKINRYDSYNAMSKAAADFIAQHITSKPNSLLCFPSGESPTGTLQYLVDYAQAGKLDFSLCRFVGLDEWVGMDERDQGSCTHYMYSHLFSPLQLKPEQIIFFNAQARDLDGECKRIDEYIFANGPIDILMVGLGLNGHIGLNEPGISFDKYSHHSPLDIVTKNTAQKYFSADTKLHEGITLGIRHMMESKMAILIASGSKKAEIIRKALQEEVNNQVPASVLQTHGNSYVFLDREAASLLK
jgi:glucosamine-6-phosphate isomerase